MVNSRLIQREEEEKEEEKETIFIFSFDSRFSNALLSFEKMKTFRRMEKKKKKKKRRIETKGEVGKTKRKREKKIKNERNWKNTIFLDKYAKFIPR